MSRDSLEILGSKKTTDTSDRRRNDTLERQGNRNRNKNRKNKNTKISKRKMKRQRKKILERKARESLVLILRARMNAAILFRSRRSIKACKARKRRKTRRNENKKLTNLVREKEDVIKEERKQKNRRTSRRNIIHKIRLRF